MTENQIEHTPSDQEISRDSFITAGSDSPQTLFMVATADGGRQLYWLIVGPPREVTLSMESKQINH